MVRNFLALFIGLTVCSFLFFGAEFILAYKDGRGPGAHLARLMGVDNSDTTPYRNKGNEYSYELPYREKLIKISMNKEGMRVVPPVVDDAQAKRYAIFSGCSFTFGDGVNDNENMPYHFQGQNPSYRSFNMGIPGGGPHHLLESLSFHDLPSIVKRDEGIFVYTYLPVHIDRVVGGIYPMEYRPNAPLFELVNGRPVHRGTFRSARPFTTHLYEFIVNSKLLKPLIWSDPWSRGIEVEVELTCQLLAESKAIISEQLPNTRFIAATYPESNSWLIPCFEKLGFEVFDFSGLQRPTDMYRPDPWHPGPEEYEWYVKMFSEKLNSTR